MVKVAVTGGIGSGKVIFAVCLRSVAYVFTAVMMLQSGLWPHPKRYMPDLRH